MSGPFFGDWAVSSSSWAAFERLVLRLIYAKGYQHASVVGQTGDGGADVLAIAKGKRWLFQVKAFNKPVGPEVVTETLSAVQKYDADVPVIVSKNGFTSEVFSIQSRLLSEGIRLQLWDMDALRRQGALLPMTPPILPRLESGAIREYQRQAIEAIVATKIDNPHGSALVVLATGLGKTFVAAESIRRMRSGGEKVLVLAHTVDLVLQLERAFWPFLTTEEKTAVITGSDRPSDLRDLDHFSHVFATRDSLANLLVQGVGLPKFSYVVVDECHHLGAQVYEQVLDGLGVSTPDGPFLLGLTATPWRPDGDGLDHRFTEPVISVDLVRGLKDGFLANVDYRMFTDNIDWARLENLEGEYLSPKSINRTLFIEEWDDAVVDRLQEAWNELGGNGRAIVFCGTIDHAIRMANRINALGFTSAQAIYSGGKGPNRISLSPVERNRMLWDFAFGRIGILCAIDILNEGVDVPDVNLVVFQRVTHSRRIFTQQLGRGLRLSEGKDRVIVLDFVTDIRRFAAGLQLDRDLSEAKRGAPSKPKVLTLHSKVTFRKSLEEDVDGKKFLKQWLQDLDAIAEAGEDVSILNFPDSNPKP
jgi:superfamily II DNA or RNA helicase